MRIANRSTPDRSDVESIELNRIEYGIEYHPKPRL